MREKMEHVKHAAEQKMWKVRAVLVDRSGENFIDSAIFSKLQQHYINVYDIDSG